MTSPPSITALQLSLSTTTTTTTSQPTDQHSLLTQPSYRHTASPTILSPAKFHEVTDLLLEKPNLNSSHLFRADILYDSAGRLKTKAQHEATLNATVNGCPRAGVDEGDVQAEMAEKSSAEEPGPLLNSMKPYRTVVRNLIPRNINLDRPLKQSCYLYDLNDGRETVVYVPQVSSAGDMPWYHPTIRALAYVFEPHTSTGEAALSVWYLPFDDETPTTITAPEIPQRLHRTLLALGSTFLRLARYQTPTNSQSSPETNGAPVDTFPPGKAHADGDIDLRPSALKDTILPQHIVQDTYARLKTTYAPFLISKWVEATPPEKHVFEDLAIAAFLVCLWRETYGSATVGVRSRFKGFVDLACGNGLLVYILNEEGWKGWGIDARRRKTWEALGLEERRLVMEGVVVPKPFVDVLGDAVVEIMGQGDVRLTESGMRVHKGRFEPGTFIISNHADELTVWTPLLAALSSLENPLPFLAIPCCSHALSGEKYRYTPKDASLVKYISRSACEQELSQHATVGFNAEHEKQQQQQSTKPPGPEQGSLHALRVRHQREREREPTSGSGSDIVGGEDKSAYGCLTKKTVQVARRLGINTTCTLMRIPSTRNIGVVAYRPWSSRVGKGDGVDEVDEREVQDDMSERCEEENGEWRGQGGEGEEQRRRRKMRTIEDVVEQECKRSGGVKKSAEVWVERAKKIHVGQGRGKVNWGGKPTGDARKNEVLVARKDGEDGIAEKKGVSKDEKDGE